MIGARTLWQNTSNNTRESTWYEPQNDVISDGAVLGVVNLER